MSTTSNDSEDANDDTHGHSNIPALSLDYAPNPHGRLKNGRPFVDDGDTMEVEAFVESKHDGSLAIGASAWEDDIGVGGFSLRLSEEQAAELAETIQTFLEVDDAE
ncbi:MAG: hypothetical protein ABEI98_10720 [Halorhabdus sp.]